jgi:hypothetical protein
LIIPILEPNGLLLVEGGVHFRFGKLNRQVILGDQGHGALSVRTGLLEFQGRAHLKMIERVIRSFLSH